MFENRTFGQRRIIALAAVAALVPNASAFAQRQQAPVPRVMVTTFASTEPGLGVQAAEAVRSRIARDVDERKLTVIPKKDIDNTLAASGYSTTEALQPNDARALAVLLRADEYVEGTAVKTPAGYKVDARLVLARDNTIAQPLPAVEAPKLDQAATALSKSYQNARNQLESEATCHRLVSEGKYREAEQAARSALTKNPQATIVGVCLLQALDQQHQNDSILAVAQRIVAVDPRNIPALRYEAAIYSEKKDPKALDALLALLAANPTDDRIREQVVNEMAASGQASRALPIIKEMVVQYPGDPKTLRTAWLVALAAKDTALAASTGMELIKADTTVADSSYYVRMGGLFAGASNYKKAAEFYIQGRTRYPNNATLWLSEGVALNKAGDNAAALQALQRALAINPKVEGGCALTAQIQGSMNQTDAMMTTIRNCVASNGGDKSTLAKLVLQAGNNAYKAGNASKNRADFQKAIQLLQFSDQLDPSADAKFLIGVSAFSIGQSAVNEAQTTKSCTLARLAKDSFTQAQENVPAGLQSYADAAKQVLTAIPQYTPAVDEMVKRYCK